ncbi:virulence factor TspB C-terminal domain-related protein [Photobacterium leiognathi]|uniref:virulence factor TspB C-terminal domain-related protein n=1 Tax=Photobacterium leiognathi TaxID=553611 RepID=UPI002980AE0D|nr:virulence factor TspB C-terminal domain-related protein [Photobacterium leiognathi]
MKWILLLVPIFFSSLSFSAEPYWHVIKSDRVTTSGYPSCEAKVDYLLSIYKEMYPERTLASLIKYCGSETPNPPYLFVDYQILWLVNDMCPSGQSPIYPSIECNVPDVPFCERPETQQFIDNEIQQCLDGTPEAHTASINLQCNPDKEIVETIEPCTYTPIGEGGDGGGSGGGDVDGGVDGGGGGGNDGDIDIGGSGGGDGGGNGGIPPSDVCKEFPELCGTGECVPPPTMPWACDVHVPPDGGDLISSIGNITSLLATNNTFTEQGVLNSAMQLVNDQAELENQVNVIDKLETVKDNSKITADNTDKITDHLQDLKDLQEYNNDLTKGILDKPVGGGASNDLMNGTNRRIDDTNTKLDETNKKLGEIKDALMEDSCANNPDDEDCIVNQLTIVGCEEFSCSGDVLKCASLELQHKAWCQAENIDWDKELNKPISDWAAAFDQTTMIDETLDFSKLDSKYLDGAGLTFKGSGCPSPEVVTIYGEKISIPYDGFCWLAKYLKPFFEALSWMYAAIIASRGVALGVK